jgi:enoyl-CoA hydratase/carnithine racemase
MELILAGQTFSGQRAFELGIFNEVFSGASPAEALAALDAHTHAFADQLAGLPPLALREAKALVKGAAHLTLDAALEREAKAQLRLLATADSAAAMASFLTKKPAVYRGC